MNQAAEAEDFEGALAKAKDLDAKADEYLKAVAQLEQEKTAFDAVADKVRPRIATASQANYKKLTPAKDEIANLQTKMDASASEEDYVGALEQANQIPPKLDELEAQIKTIGEQKQKYEDEKPILQQKLEEAAQAPHFKKLDAMLQELNAGQGQIDQLAQDEDFEGAFNSAKELETKADAYLKAAAEADEQKKAFEKVVD